MSASSVSAKAASKMSAKTGVDRWASLPTDLLQEVLLLTGRKSRENLASTSRGMQMLVKDVMTTWDISNGDFTGADKERRAIITKRDPESKPLTAFAITIITVNADCDKNGLMGHQLLMLKRMSLALDSKMNQFRRLEFHNCPLLTVKILEMIVPQMTNLDILGIYGCPLITVMDTISLMRIIREPPHEHSTITLDFYPSVNITHFRNIDLGVALPAYLYRFLQHAREIHSGLMEFGGAFHLWLNDVTRCRAGGKMSWKLIKHIEKNEQHDDVVKEIAPRKNKNPGMVVNVESNEGRYYPCRSCDVELRGCFFAKAQLRQSLDDPECWGCRMDQELCYVRYDIDGMAGLHKQVNKWLGRDLSWPRAIRKARAEKRTEVPNDTSWADAYQKRQEEANYEKLVEQGKVKRGQPIPGRYNWAKVPAYKAR